jgi:DNA mismatch repair protein MutS
VAKLAGVPDSVIERAKNLAEELSAHDITESAAAEPEQSPAPKRKKKKVDEVDMHQMSFVGAVTDEDVLRELKEINITTLTPIEAMNTLYALQNKLKNRWEPEMK